MRKKLRVGDKRIFLIVLFLGVVDFLCQWYFRLIDFGFENTGVSFGWLAGNRGGVLFWLLLMLIFYWWMKASNLGLFLVLVGGVVNMAQRSIWGSVWDFIPWSLLGFWNNGADILIFVGVILYLFTYGRHRD